MEASLEKQLMFLEAPPKTRSCGLGQAAGPLPSPSPAHSEDMPYFAGLWGWRGDCPGLGINGPSMCKIVEQGSER